MDRLTAVDAGFLDQERGGAHLHVGAVLICDGPSPSQAQFMAHLQSRLDAVPRYRQRLAEPPLRMGKPYWVDDPAFNLAYHVRHTALPSPGGEEELRRLAGRIFAQRLDRSKPLWELWVVEGLDEGRFALINKTHHAVVDGVSGIDITTALFDLQPAGARGEQPAAGAVVGPAASLAGRTRRPRGARRGADAGPPGASGRGAHERPDQGPVRRAPRRGRPRRGRRGDGYRRLAHAAERADRAPPRRRVGRARRSRS